MYYMTPITHVQQISSIDPSLLYIRVGHVSRFAVRDGKGNRWILKRPACPVVRGNEEEILSNGRTTLCPLLSPVWSLWLCGCSSGRRKESADLWRVARWNQATEIAGPPRALSNSRTTCGTCSNQLPSSFLNLLRLDYCLLLPTFSQVHLKYPRQRQRHRKLS